MKRSSHLRVLVAVLLAATTLLACESLFGIEPSQRRSDDAVAGASAGGGVGGGRAGSGGTNAAGESGESTGGGGAAGGTTEGGASGTGAGTTSGGNGGMSGGGNGGGGDGGSAGDAGTIPPEPGGSCDEDDAMACSTVNSRLLLRCENGVWKTLMSCPGSQHCNPRHLECQPFDIVCRDHPEGICLDNGIIDCASDPFSPPRRVCPFGCARGACLPGVGDQLIVHTEPHAGLGVGWPHGTISVCFAGDESEERSLRRWTQSAVEADYERYLDIDFVGWAACENDAVGVVIEFLDECRGRLAGAVPLGFRGPRAQVRVGICRSYHDADGMPHELDEPLARAVARHQFGHVLGLPEECCFETRTAMLRGIRSTNVASHAWASDIAALYDRYGYKPKASIVHESGTCLDVSEGIARLSPCSDDAEQRHYPFPSGIESEGTAQCLVIREAGGDSLVESVACSAAVPESLVTMRRARWSSPGHCVAPRSMPVVPGTLLETRACAPVGDETQTWTFEILEVVANVPQARIRFAAENYCVTTPTPFDHVDGEVPTLEPCGPESTVFHLRPDGIISLPIPDSEGRICLGWVGSDGIVQFRSECAQTFWFSGPLETIDGRALTADPDDPGAGLFVEPRLNELPGRGQVFDVAF